MKKQHYSIVINAPREKVWDTMLGAETYKEWTSAFNPGSYYEGNWEEGSEMRFLGPDPETGKEGGVISKVAENRPHAFVSLQHISMFKNGVEDTEETKKWTDAYENYTFTDKDGGTEVSVDMNIADEYESMFDEMWHNALQKLKEMCER